VSRRALLRSASAFALLAVAVAVAAARGASAAPTPYVVHRLVADVAGRAPFRDPVLVNAWGLALEPGGPWWTANQARSTSTVYSGEGRKQLLTVAVAGGPTGVAFYGGTGFRVSAGRHSDPARFVYACEDGRIRAWTPTVPDAWSTRSLVVVDEVAEAAVFRGVAVLGERVYATDFHNARVAVYDRNWRRVRRPGAFVDGAIPEWYAPFGIQALGGRIFVTYVYRAPVNGNDAPTGGYVDEFDRNGRLLARVAHRGALNAPWGLAVAPRSFGRFGGDLLVANFGDGRINAYRHAGRRWAYAGALRARDGRPIAVNGLWGIAFGDGGPAGPRNTLFFTSGPHRWLGATELAVHGLLGSITAG
jgi:uncharacterized protein (TIGR03118 family)